MTLGLPQRLFFYTSRCIHCARELAAFRSIPNNLPASELEETDAPVEVSALDGMTRCAFHELAILRRATTRAAGASSSSPN